MKHLILILALAQPRSNMVKAEDITIAGESRSVGLWLVGWPKKMCEPVETCKHTPIIVAKETDASRIGNKATIVFTIEDGDEPKGPCNLGDLVRAANAHLDLEIAAAKAAHEADVKQQTILNTLRAEVAKCEPKGKR